MVIEKNAKKRISIALFLSYYSLHLYIGPAHQAQAEARARAQAQAKEQAQAEAQAASAAQIVRENAEALAAARAQHEAAVVAARAQIAAIEAVRAEWQEVADPASGSNYYYHAGTQATQWEAPELWVRICSIIRAHSNSVPLRWTA